MNLVRRLISLVRESPTFGRDRAAMLSGASVGITAMLLNGAVLFMLMPVMLDPDDRDFRMLTENIEFGQLMALILMGGATAFATFLIPLRLISVFWGPRLGRYFDQIVLSGISPLRFVIGKATSQNLFLALILFLLLPWLVLCLTLGGVDLSVLVVSVLLIWLYCMALSLVTLWAALYLNELLAAAMVIGGAVVLSVLGCLPIPIQPFVLTPFPALIHGVYSAMPQTDLWIQSNYGTTVLTCAMAMTVVAVMAIIGIHLGPLYGIIQENSTFGEVVKQGDSQRKRWFRLRLHIQRPSELAFFYENRGVELQRNEGLIRWGVGLLGLTALMLLAWGAFLWTIARLVPGWAAASVAWWVFEFHVTGLVFHGIGVFLAAVLFSHTRNSTYLRVPLIAGRKMRVATLDTAAFATFLLLSTVATIAIPFAFDTLVAQPTGQTLFPASGTGGPLGRINFLRLVVEGPLTLSLAGLTVYALLRLGCLQAWLRSGAMLVVSAIYFGGVCVFPLVVAAMGLDLFGLRTVPAAREVLSLVAMVSPMTVMLALFDELGRTFSDAASTIPFYLAHVAILTLVVLLWRRIAPGLRRQYRNLSPEEAV